MLRSELGCCETAFPRWQVRDFACREPERYYELASPSADRQDNSTEGKGRRRQFMWMVEMYGYVFGAAEAGIPKHRISHNLMRYTADVVRRPPRTQLPSHHRTPWAACRRPPHAVTHDAKAFI